jgi:hypothetical protein
MAENILSEISVGKPEGKMTTLGDLDIAGKILTSINGKQTSVAQEQVLVRLVTGNGLRN